MSITPVMTHTHPSSHVQGYVQPASDRFAFRDGAGGNMIWLHLPLLADLASRAPSGVIVEVGTGCGDGSTHAFDLGLRANPAPDAMKRHVGVCDHPPADEWTPDAPWWRFVKGYSTDPDVTEAVRDLLVDPEVGRVHRPDILYIDTTHDYATLRAEMALWTCDADGHGGVGGPRTLYLFHDTYMGGAYNPMTEAAKETVRRGGRLRGTHEWRDLSTACSGMGALVPKVGREVYGL